MKREKVRKNSEFKIIYRRGRSLANHLLVLYIMQKRKNIYDDEKFNRLGISVSKKVGNSVVRSRVRRLISESYRLNKEDIKKGHDFVIIARNTSKDRSYAEIEKSLISIFKKAGLYKYEKNIN